MRLRDAGPGIAVCRPYIVNGETVDDVFKAA